MTAVERPRRRSGEPREPARTAALIHTSDTPAKSKLAGAGRKVAWQKKVQDYDRNGPGVLGYYLDTIALMASLCPLYPEVRTPAGTWERSYDPILVVAVAGYRSKLMSQSDLVYTAVRGREAVGEVWHVADPDVGFNVTLNGQVNGRAFTWVDAYGVSRVVDLQRVWRSIVPDLYEPWLPTSPVRRALPELRRLRAAVRNQIRSAESRLIVNGLLAFPSDSGGTQPLTPAASLAGDGDGPELTGIQQVIDDYLTLAREAYQNDDSPAAAVPFPYEGAPAQLVELGRMIDPSAMEAERAATAGFARAVNFPEQLLTAGPGAANHWNEYLLQETQVKLGLVPKLKPVCEDITRFYLAERVEELSRRLPDWNYDSRRVRVAFDTSFLLRRPARTSEMMEAYRLGIATRLEVAEELGITDMMVIPDGLSEYEHWELATGSKGAPYAEVGPDGELIIPPPPEGAPMDAAGFPMPAADQVAPGEEALVSDPAAPAAIAPSPDVVDEPPAGPVLAAMPAEDPVAKELNRMMRDAAKRDLRLDATLTGITQAVAAAVTTEVAKQVIQAHPARSAERAALRKLPVEEVWEAADPGFRSEVDVEAVVADVVERARPQIEQAYRDAEKGFWEKWGHVVAPAATGVLIGAATANLVAGLTGWFTAKVVEGKLAAARVPTEVIRTSMTVAGGARIDAEGTVQRSAAGTPVPVGGGEWWGNTGFLTGHNTVSNVTGRRPRWRWEHGWFGEPETPFPPHVELDGQEFDSPGAIPGGWTPQDHAGCRCLLLAVFP